MKNRCILILIIFLLLPAAKGWAQVSQSGENGYVKYLCGDEGFDIQFKLNGTGDWLPTTYQNEGYGTKIQVNNGTEENLYTNSFAFGTVYTVNGIAVSIEASISDATTRAVTIQYNIENRNDYPVTLKIGSWADTKVGTDDTAIITREGKNKIMMTAREGTENAGAMYGIQAGTDEFTTLWYGYWDEAKNHVFVDNGGNYDYCGHNDSKDSGIAWSWTVSLPAHGTKIIAFGGLASQKGAVSMAGYRYGETPSTPTVSGIEGSPSITYYYNTSDSNSGGTLWSGITGTSLAPGKYYMYAVVGATSTTEAMTTPTTPFTVAKGRYNMSGVSFPNGTFTYDGNPHSLAISGSLPSGVSVTYQNNSRTNAGSQTVTAVFSTTNANYEAPASMTATLTVNRATPQATDFTYTAPSNLMYDGTSKAATVVTHLTGGKTGMGAVTVNYFRGTTPLGTIPPTDVGTYIVKINVAQGDNYNAATGITAATWTFSISKRAITTTAITVADLDYNASDQTTAGQVTVAYNGITIPASNYTVEPATVKEAGTYTLTITGKNNLTSFITKTLQVTKAMNGTYTNDFTISDIPTQIYKGAAIHPTVSVYDNGRLLTEGVDYTVSYGTNSSEGASAGTITISGAGVYTGSLNRTFGIVNEYFTENNAEGVTISYHATSSTTVAVGTRTHTAAIATETKKVSIPGEVTHATLRFQVTDIEDGAFVGCAALRYIDFSDGTAFVPTSLERTVAPSPFYGVPKQTLVYLNSTVITGENYVYKPGSEDKYLCDEFKIYDDVNGSQTGFAGSDYEWAFENKYTFTAKNIINTRRMLADQHYTLCLPYDLRIPESFKAYQLAGDNTANNLIGFQEVTGTLTQFTPYVIIPTETGQLLNTTDTEVPAFTVADEAAKAFGGVPAGGDFTLYGSMRYIKGSDATDATYIMQMGNTWKRISGGEYDGACILPMRAYIIGPAVGGGTRPYLTATFTNAGNGTTRVDQLRLDENPDGANTNRTNDAIYDLHGRRVSVSSVSSVFSVLPKGVYIINGKKVVK